jgi:hypothetical protein
VRGEVPFGVESGTLSMMLKFECDTEVQHGFWLIAGLDDARASRVEIDREAG